MNRNTFFATLIALVAAPFVWAAGKLRADQLAANSTGVQRILTVGVDNKFGSLGIGTGLTSDGTTLSATPPAASTPVLLTRNPDGTYPYSGGAIFRNGLLQVSPGDYSVSGAILTPNGWNPDDQVVKM